MLVIETLLSTSVCKEGGCVMMTKFNISHWTVNRNVYSKTSWQNIAVSNTVSVWVTNIFLSYLPYLSLPHFLLFLNKLAEKVMHLTYVVDSNISLNTYWLCWCVCGSAPPCQENARTEPKTRPQPIHCHPIIQCWIMSYWVGIKLKNFMSSSHCFYQCYPLPFSYPLFC
jgi:hypothetical protein